MSQNTSTKEEALQLLLELAEKRRQSYDQESLRIFLSDELISEVFESAWAHQWDTDTDSFKRETRSCVRQAVQEVVKDAD